jgi:DNA (cytosine-5)-methyltransferase 1
MKLLDLFSGIGGFSLAARWANIETIQFVEKDEFCKKVLMKNFPNVPIHDDIRTFNFHEDVEILTGGFPCQPFSVAGKKKGLLDDRFLWPEMLRIIRQCHPDWVIAENVTGIVAMELDNILTDLEREGYESQAFIIPACAANAPHRRDRLWIVANAMRKRCDNGFYYWESGHIQKDKEWDLATLQSEWSQLIPESWQTMQGGEWMFLNSLGKRINDGIPTKLDKDRIKALGNAIVPQIAYVLLKSIVLCETSRLNVVR